MAEPTPTPTPESTPTLNPIPTPNLAPESTPEPAPNTGTAPLTIEAVQELINNSLTSLQETLGQNMQTQLNNALSESKRLEKMTQEEREAEEARIERENFERERQEFEHEKLINQTSQILIDKNLSPKFAKFLAGADADETKQNIDEFEKLYNADHQARVNEQLRGTPPTVPISGAAPAKPVEQMTYTEMTAYFAAQGGN